MKKFIICFAFIFFGLVKQVQAQSNIVHSPKKGLGGPVPVSHFNELGIKWFFNWSFIPGLKDPNSLGIGNSGNINWDPLLWEKFVPLFFTVGKDWISPIPENYQKNIDKICNFTNHCHGGYYLVGNEPNDLNQDWGKDYSDQSTPIYLPEADSIERNVRVYGEIIKLIRSKDSGAKIILLGLLNRGTTNSATGGVFDQDFFNKFIDKWQEVWQNDAIVSDLTNVISGWHFHLYERYDYCPTSDVYIRNAKQKIDQKIQEMHNNFGWTIKNQEIWITEMSSLVGVPGEGAMAERAKFKNRIACLTNVFENSPLVNRYAWFFHGCSTVGENSASACYGQDWRYVSLYFQDQNGYSQTDLRPIYASLPDVVSPTPIPSSFSHINFNIKLEGINSSGRTRKVRVVVKNGSTEIKRFENVSLTSVSGGIFQGRVIDIPTGTYDIYIKGEAHLQKKFNGITLTSGENTKDWSTTILQAGDFVGPTVGTNPGPPDNILNFDDVSAILGKYTAVSVPVDNTNRIYDVDADNMIKMADVSIVLSNYTAIQVSGE